MIVMDDAIIRIILIIINLCIIINLLIPIPKKMKLVMKGRQNTRTTATILYPTGINMVADDDVNVVVVVPLVPLASL